MLDPASVIVLLVPVSDQPAVLSEIEGRASEIRDALVGIDHICLVCDSIAVDVSSVQEHLKAPFFRLVGPLPTPIGQIPSILRGVESEPDAAAYAVCDLDHLLEPEQVRELLRHFTGQTELVRGVRVRRKRQGLRRLLSAGMALVNHACGDMLVRDIGSSLFVVRREIAQRCVLVTKTHRSLFLPLLLRSWSVQYAEVEVCFQREHESSYSLRELWQVFRLYWDTRELLRSGRIEAL